MKKLHLDDQLVSFFLKTLRLQVLVTDMWKLKELSLIEIVTINSCSNGCLQ